MYLCDKFVITVIKSLAISVSDGTMVLKRQVFGVRVVTYDAGRCCHDHSKLFGG